MEMYEDALECSDIALSYDPTNVKAKLRRAKALVRLHMFDEAKKQFRAAARDEDKRIKKTANSWIKYAENEAIRVQNLALRREFIEKSNAKAQSKSS